MQTKKNPRADLNRYISLFLWLGLVFSLFVFWRFIEYKQPENPIVQRGRWYIPSDEVEQNTEVEVEKPAPVAKPPKVVPTIIKKVHNNQPTETPDFLPTEMTDEPVDQPDDIPTSIPGDEPTEPIEGLDFVDSAPVFPGCEKYEGNKEKLKKCLTKKIRRFVHRRFDQDLTGDLGITGTVKINVIFVVDKQGRISQIKAVSPYKELRDEATRVIQSLPAMKPGKKGGKNVNVMYRLPIVFRVN